MQIDRLCFMAYSVFTGFVAECGILPTPESAGGVHVVVVVVVSPLPTMWDDWMDSHSSVVCLHFKYTFVVLNHVEKKNVGAIGSENGRVGQKN